jgi:hypothetical protein
MLSWLLLLLLLPGLLPVSVDAVDEARRRPG